MYCKSGYRAAVANSALRMMGYDNTFSFSGSWLAWTGAEEEISTEMVEAEVVGDPGFAPELVKEVDAFLSTIPEGWMIVDLDTVKAGIDAGAFILDIRTEGEYAEGHIGGAVNIPLRSLTERMSEIPTDKSVIVHCKSGFRAALSAPVLGVLGYDNLKVFNGSYVAWVDAGEPVVTG